MLRDIAIILRGSLVAQAIGFLILPILSRLFTPDAFGNFQLFQAISSVLLVFAAMRYEVALLRAENDRELRATFWLCLAVTVGITVAVAIVAATILGTGWPARAAALPFSILLFPLALLAGGIAQFLSYVVTRESAFSTSAHSKMAQSGVYALVALAIGAIAPITSGLILADIAGRIALAGVLLAWCFRRRRDLLEPANRNEVLASAGKYRAFPLVTLPGTIANSLGSVLTPMMIYATYSPYISGQFGLVDRSLTIPMAMVIAAVSQVYMAGLAGAIRTPGQSALLQFRRIVRNLALAGLVPACVVIAFGPVIFVTLFGHRWELAGEFARIMAPAYLFLLVSGAVNMTLLVLGRQKLQLAWELGRLGAMVVIWTVISVLHLSEFTAVTLHTVTIILCSIVFLVVAHRTVQTHDDSEATTEAVPEQG
jgi:O-antigen/teichoic acid export membrane protein